jgi:NifU-like protein
MADAPLSTKALARLRDLTHVGELTEEDATTRALRLVETVHGAQQAADHIRLMLLLDPAGVVVDARYRTLATGAQLAMYDLLVERLIGKDLDAAAAITPNQIEAELRDDPARPVLALGEAGAQPFYIVRKALERLHGVAPAPEAPAKSGAAALPWTEVGLFEKVRRIESVLDEHVRPALASDGGGMDLVDLAGDTLHVQYHGACGSCSSSIGGTLQFVQDSLNNHLGTALTVQVTGYDEEGPSIL